MGYNGFILDKASEIGKHLDSPKTFVEISGDE